MKKPSKDHPEKLFAERISRNTDKFTPSDHMIAGYLLRTYPAGFLQTASELAKELKINVSTVTRFFPKIGYQNIKEVTADLRQDILFLINSPLDRFDAFNQNPTNQNHVIKRLLELELSNIQRTFSTIDESVVKSFIDLIGDQSVAVYVLGVRKEFSLSFYFYYQLASLRDSVRLLQPTNLVDQLSRMKPDDLIIVFDFRRYSDVHTKAAQYIKNRGGHVIVFADSPISPAAYLADLLFLTKTEGLSAFDSYTAVIALINVIFVMVIETHSHLFKAKWERIEELYKRFGIFSFQKNALPSSK